MRSVDEIKIRLIETIGEIRRMEGKCTLLGLDSAEEWEVFDALCTERDALQWVLAGGPKCPVCGKNLEPDVEYPNDLLCERCCKVFDRGTLAFARDF